MENDKFQLFTTILESMKYEDMKHSNLENTIVNIIDRFGNYLDSDQKKKILREFIKYERTKKENDRMKHRHTESEKQNEFLQRSMSSEQFDW